MPRIESFALKAAEGRNAVDRARRSEDNLIASLDRFSKYALKRKVRVIAQSKGDEKHKLTVRPLSEKKRLALREGLKSLADAAT